MNFDSWLQEVDSIFFNRYQCYSDDVEDWLWYDAFSSGATPREAFEDWAASHGRFDI